MEINDKLLEKLSKLCALHLNEEEKAEVKNYLKETLSHFEAIKKIDTKGVKPLVSPLNPPLVLRKDQPLEFSDKEQILKQTPERQGSLIKVPPTV